MITQTRIYVEREREREREREDVLKLLKPGMLVLFCFRPAKAVSILLHLDTCYHIFAD